MKILRADHLGMCFGVRDAITLAKEHIKSGPLTILGQLAHNERVNQSLQGAGIQISNNLEEVTTKKVMITAHGAAEETIRKIKIKGHKVIEATCPLVRSSHKALESLVQADYYPIIIGKAEHVEVKGLTGDLVKFHVVLTEEDIELLPNLPRFGIVSQTTQPISKVQHLVDLIREKFPTTNIRFIDTVCRPTKERQEAAANLAKQAEVVLVIGGSNSNNTKELTQTCRLFCDKVYQIQDAAEIQTKWISKAKVVGITAGTSTPDEVIDAVENQLQLFSKEEIG